MANLRIVYDNAADRASLTASSTAGSLGITNTQVDKKSKVWRSTGTTASITATWSTSELVSCVALPFCNLSSTATIRVRGYALSTDTVPLFDTTARLAAAFTPLGLFDWGGVALGVNSYSYAGGTYGVSWFEHASVKKLVINIADPDNISGYLECSRLVTGSHWSPKYNTAFGIPVNNADKTIQERTDSGDLTVTRGVRFKELSFDLSWMIAADRQRFNEISRGNGLHKKMFISIFPEDVDTEKEQTYQIYGNLSQVGALSHTMHTIYASTLTISEA